MKHLMALVLVLLGFGGAVVSQGLPVALAADPHGSLLEIDGAIQPMSARYLSRGLDAATNDGAQLLIVLLDTPGGLLSSTRDMVETILASDIPVVVYVSPSGAQAASAGSFVTAAAHIAVMAPVTTIGAASPVGVGGEDLSETLKSKATQDAAAFMRDIARERGRNVEALEQAVLEAKSYSASEALEINVIDLIARDLEDLLAQLDGRTVQLKEGSTVLKTANLGIRRIEQTPLERFLGLVADPNIAFLLLSLGTLGIFIEFMHPGLLMPGIAGVIALALAFVAMGNLPVNWVGVGLLVLSLVLLVFEMHAPGIGVFGISGVISFVLGAFLLFGGISPPPIPTPSFRVNLWLISGVAVTMFGGLMFLLRDIMAARAGGTSGPTTVPSLVGLGGVATSDLAPSGSVHVAGEQWSAVSDSGEPIYEGESVMVLEAEGLKLKVFKSPIANESTEESIDRE